LFVNILFKIVLDIKKKNIISFKIALTAFSSEIWEILVLQNKKRNETEDIYFLKKKWRVKT